MLGARKRGVAMPDKKRRRKKYIRMGVCGVLALSAAVLILHPVVSSAYGVFPGVESVVSEKVQTGESYHILEIVPDGAKGEIGYLAAGSEPDYFQDRMEQYLAAHTEDFANTGENRTAYMNGLIQELTASGLCGSGAPLDAQEYQEEYFPTEEQQGQLKRLNFPESAYETVTAEGAYVPNKRDTGSYVANVVSFRYDEAGDYAVEFEATAPVADIAPYNQPYAYKSADAGYEAVEEPQEGEIYFYISEYVYVGEASVSGEYLAQLDAEVPYSYTAAGDGGFDFVPGPVSEEQPGNALHEVTVGHVWYSGGITNRNWFRDTVLNAAGEEKLGIAVQTVTESQLASADLSGVNFIYISGEGSDRGLGYGRTSPESYDKVKELYGMIREGVPCLIDASVLEGCVTGYDGSDVAKLVVWALQRDPVEEPDAADMALLVQPESLNVWYAGAATNYAQDNIYCMATTDADGIRHPFFTDLTEYISQDADAGFAAVHALIAQENSLRVPEEYLDTGLTKAGILQYIINYQNARVFEDKTKLCVLDVEPAMGDLYLQEDTADDRILTKDKLADWTGVARENITIVRMTSAEFIGRIEDLNTEYDMIYFGLGYAANGNGAGDYLNRNSEGTVVYNDSLMDGLVYTHTGDAFIRSPILEGLLDTEYVCNDPTNYLYGYLEGSGRESAKDTYGYRTQWSSALGKLITVPHTIDDFIYDGPNWWGDLTVPGNKPNANDVQNPFKDVFKSNWFYEDVMFVYGNGLMTGTSANTFAPNDPTTRAACATVLWRMDGSPEPDDDGTSFRDVPDGQWYTDGVRWAAQKGIVTGSDGLFRPNDPLTREQLAVFFWRFAKYRNYDVSTTGSLNGFPDANDVSSWAVDAFEWAVGDNLIAGRLDTVTNIERLAPKEIASRADYAAIIHRFLEKYWGVVRPVTVGNVGVFRSSGNDITETAKKKLEEYIGARYPVVFASGFLKADGSIDGQKLDNSSILYAFLKENIEEDNVFCLGEDGKPQQQEEFRYYMRMPKLELHFFNPATGEEEQEVPLATGIERTVSNNYGNKIVQLVDGRSGSGICTMRWHFRVDSSVDASSGTRYKARLYLDMNADGKFVSNDTYTEAQIDCLILDESGNEAGRDADGSYILSSGMEYFMTKDIPSDYWGNLTWKLEIVQEANPYIRTSKVGYTILPRSGNGEIQVIRVLQIMGNDDWGGGWNLQNDSDMRTYFGRLEASTGVRFEITSIRMRDFDGIYRSYASLQDYQMLIFGFQDSYTDMKNLETLAAVSEYINSGNSVLFTHDTTSFVNVETEEMYSFDVATDSDTKWLAYRGLQGMYLERAWGYHINQWFRDSLGMDRYGITCNEVTAINPQASLLRSTLLKEGQLLDISWQTAENGSTVAVGTIDTAHGGITTRKDPGGSGERLVSTVLGSDKDIAYVANSGRTQSYGETHGYTYGALNFHYFQNWLDSYGAVVSKYSLNRYMQWRTMPLSGWRDDASIGKLDNMRATQVNEGQITHYPYEIGNGSGTGISIAKTHCQYWQLNMDEDIDSDGDSDIVVWYCLSASGADKEFYTSSPNDVRNNYYIYSIGNVTYSGVGDNKVTNPDEKKLFVNTIVAAYRNGIKNPTVMFLQNGSRTSEECKALYIHQDNTIGSKTLDKDAVFYYMISEPNLVTSSKQIYADYRLPDGTMLPLTDPGGGAAYITTEAVSGGGLQLLADGRLGGIRSGSVYKATLHNLDDPVIESFLRSNQMGITVHVTSEFDYYGDSYGLSPGSYAPPETQRTLDVLRLTLFDLD